MASFLGLSEIQWIALEAFGTISVAVLALLAIFNNIIINYLKMPKIEATKPEITYQGPRNKGERGTIQITWQIHNEPRIKFFGDHSVNLITRYWFDKKEHEGWTYSGSIDELPILPKNEKWSQSTGMLTGELEEREYIIFVVFYQADLKNKESEKVIGHSNFILKWPPKGYNDLYSKFEVKQ